ncbi:MAG: protein kinase [Acidobacteria bacterium]|nr:protein kinase [Acidobacteriota bacterium]
MGEVYRARDTRLDRAVAIKILPVALAADPQFRERFDREARAISQLSHPNICTLHDVGEHDGTAFLVMELIEGETLESRLNRVGRVLSDPPIVAGSKGPGLQIDQALTIAIEVASALDAAHRAGIVHRDLKPGNVMLTKSGAKLLDFGLAKYTCGRSLGPGGKWQISTGRGLVPTWSRTKHELFYGTANGQIMVAPYTVEGDSFRAEKPRLWSDGRFVVRAGNRSFDLHPDGERFALAPAARK